MMLYPAVNELNELVDSRYTLCILAAKRARDIIDGKPVLTEVPAERPVSLATNEIAEGKITYSRIDLDKVEAEQRSEDFAEEHAAAEEAAEEAETEEASEAIASEEAETEEAPEAVASEETETEEAE